LSPDGALGYNRDVFLHMPFTGSSALATECYPNIWADDNIYTTGSLYPCGIVEPGNNQIMVNPDVPIVESDKDRMSVF